MGSAAGLLIALFIAMKSELFAGWSGLTEAVVNSVAWWKGLSMKRSSAICLQTIVVLIGIAVFVFLLWEPLIEGRNAHATLFEVYFKDAFLVWAYVASAFFFTALYQLFRLLGDAGRNGAFSPYSLRALRTIKYCALIIIGFIAVGEAYLFTMVRGEDDIAGGVAMGLFVALLCAAVAAAAVLFGKALQARILTHEPT